ncbi:MAG TPA: IS4 family transposase [Sphingobacteriaceae bacterium]|nr:IS4 family transposase [Sphingobacteriaceae bacterium]
METVNFTNRFGDSRIERRAEALLKRLFQSGSRTIQSLSFSRAEQKAFYRILRNEKASEEKLIEELSHRCSLSAKGKIVLAIQDTTEVNLINHYNRLDRSSGVGTLDGSFERNIGFKVHPSLVLDASNGFPLGFSGLRIWNRTFDKPTKKERKYFNQPIKEKESYKWLETSQKTKTCLSEAEAVIIIQDREGDIFEQFIEVPDNKTYLLIRSQVNRRLSGGEKLWDKLSTAELAGSYSVFLSSDSHSKEPARQAEIEVRFIQAEIQAPQIKGSLKPQTLYAVEAKEVNSTALEPIIWRLLTSWPVESFEHARLIIEWYTCRWVIEEVFRLLKKEGFDIEGSELESGWAIRKLCVMLLDTVLKVLQMHMAYHMPEGENPDISVCFDTEELQCLRIMNKKAEGKTMALRNPYKATELRWATWVIARNGGWKGYKTQRPPGMTTIWKGIQRFYDVYEGWNLLKDVGTR